MGHGGANGGTLVSIGARLGGAPIGSWRSTELFDLNAAEHGSRKWHDAKFSPPEDGGVGAFLVPDLQEGAAIQTNPKLTPKSQLLFRVPGWDLGGGGRNLSYLSIWRLTFLAGFGTHHALKKTLACWPSRRLP